MKPVSSNLQAHLNQEVMQLATCWKLTRRDNVVMGFTSHQKDITFESVQYKAATGFTPSAVSSHSGLEVDQLDVEAILDSNQIAVDDIHAGIYDFAEIEIFMVNYSDLTQGKLVLRRGWLGEIRYNESYFNAEVRGLGQKLTQTIGDLYSPRCRAAFADTYCGVNGASFTHTGTVEQVSNQRRFTDSSLAQEDGYYNYGLVSFTSGHNNGLAMEVKYYQSDVIELALPMAYAIQVGDDYTIVAGCDKRFDTCKSRFSNAVNFRGEPHVPGNDKLISGK